MTRDALDAAILAAHESGISEDLAALYLQAGKLVLDDGDVDHACFLLTAAMVYGFDAGIEDGGEARRLLVRFGREL